MGYAIAAELAKRGASVTLVSGPTQLQTPAGCARVDVRSAREMHQAVLECAQKQPLDICIMAAAVADYHPEYSTQKIKKNRQLQAITEP